MVEIDKHNLLTYQALPTEDIVMILGLVLFVAGFLLEIPILTTLGVFLLIFGGVLAILGATGRAVGNRRHYF